MSWLQGIYVMKAVNPKKGSKMIEYDKEPMRITPMTEEEEIEEVRRRMAERAAQMNAAMKARESKTGYVTGERLGQ